MKKDIHIILYLLTIALSTQAQQLMVNAPSHVATGETFRLEYTINTVNVSGDLVMGDLPDAFEVVFGPSISRQESYSVRNAHVSGSSSITYTYMLIGNKSGTFTIPPAKIHTQGKTLTSDAIKINVSGNTGKNQQQGGGVRFHNDNKDQHHPRQAGSPITEKDIFMRTIVSKTHVHEQEAILLTYKVYYLVDLNSLTPEMPDLKGFHMQEIPVSQQIDGQIEKINGRNYKSVTRCQYVLYPQATGELEIPSVTFHGIVVQENRFVDPYEAFFNGGSGMVDVKCDIQAPGKTIKVDALPTRPANFSGGVGRFNISAQIDKNEVKAGNPVNIRIVVGGNGNLKLIKQPEINLPKDFDKYDPKVTDKTKLTTNGVEGNMVYDVLVVPRNQGEYTIPPVEFTYYDTSSNAYKTIKSQSFKINVLKGDGNSSTVVDYSDQKAKDIRPIKTENTPVHKVGHYFYGSTSYWCWIAFPLVFFIALLVIFRKRAIDNANIGQRRNKKANKVATRRLRYARELMSQGKQGEFYDEVMRALWGYVGDKLNMPAEQLSRENINDKLVARGVDGATVDTFITALDDCEYERYAPGDATGNMNKTFEAAMTTIMTIENTMKAVKKNRRNTQFTILMLALLLLATGHAKAITKANADAEYAKENYQQAIKDYEELLKKGVNAELYYNLGNAYFRTDNFTRAVLNYERALQLSPGDEDIRLNLQLARSKTIDKITPQTEMFFVTWYRSLVNLMSVDSWARTAIAAIILALALILSYLFADHIWMRKVGFYGACSLIIVFVLGNVFACQQKDLLENHRRAIVMSSSASVKTTPTKNGQEAFVIHDGTRVTITDTTITEWRGVRLDDGREGWVETRQIEEI